MTALHVRRGLRTALLATTAITAAIVVYGLATLPPPALRLDGAPPPTHVAGAYHLHSVRSDGTGSVDDIARAASRAGLAFVILTDHGDATREPDAPAYRHGVLVIDAVEVNSREGHIVALGLTKASPYPLAGPARDVVDDIHRQGGVAIVAHPDSPRGELAWRGNAGIPVDGFEWLNVDSEWRDESTAALVRTALHAIVRPPEAIAALFSRPVRSLQRWDATARSRSVIGLAALDAHANIPWREQEEPRRTAGFEHPSYETMFRTLTQTVVTDAPLSGDAAADARAVLSALIAGRTYSTVRAYAWPSALEFSAERDGHHYVMGTRLPESSDPVTFTARLPLSPGAHLTLVRDGLPHRTGQGSLVVAGIAQLGVYRIEASLPSSGIPWIVSNPIVIEGGEPEGGPFGGRGRGGRGGGGGEPTGVVHAEAVPLDPSAWTTEHDALSTGTIGLDAGRLQFAYDLGAGSPRGQYVALVHDPGNERGIETVAFTAAASAPMRMSVQVRLPEGRGRVAQRWRTSVYVGTTPTRIELRLQDFEPADRPTQRRPIVTPLQSLLFVVDTINARPGTTGRFWLSDVTLGVNRLD